jgi:hypothetical protein
VSRGTARIAVVGDTHCPFVEQLVLEWACREIKAFKPTVIVMNGDLIEAAHASVHPNEYDHDAVDEFASAAKTLNKLKKAGTYKGVVPRLIRTDGNHCDNPKQEDPRRVPKSLRRAVDPTNNKDHHKAFDEWQMVPYEFTAKGAIQFGQVFVFHDFDGAWDTNAIRMNNILGGYSHRLAVSGHRHRVFGPDQVMRTKSIPLPLWGASPGTLGPLKPKWTSRQDTSHWGHGLCLIEAKMGRACQPGRNWSCEVMSYPGA